MTPLRQKMIDAMRLRHFSASTQQSYVEAVAGLARFYKQSPDRLDREKIQTYLLHLITERQLSWSTCNVVISALRFFYTYVIKMGPMALDLPPRKKVTQLPEILSSQELERLFTVAARPHQKVLLMTTYAAGLRVSEVVSLKLTDIDSQRMMIRVRQSKGNKDRYTVLSPRLLTELRLYWRMYRPHDWLFPGRDGKTHLSTKTAQYIYYQAKKRAGIKKGRGIHTLRHCFATHLLEAGVDLPTLQMLMGHKSVTNTMVYLQLTTKKLSSVESPLDLLQIPTRL